MNWPDGTDIDRMGRGTSEARRVDSAPHHSCRRAYLRRRWPLWRSSVGRFLRPDISASPSERRASVRPASSSRPCKPSRSGRTSPQPPAVQKRWRSTRCSPTGPCRAKSAATQQPRLIQGSFRQVEWEPGGAGSLIPTCTSTCTRDPEHGNSRRGDPPRPTALPPEDGDHLLRGPAGCRRPGGRAPAALSPNGWAGKPISVACPQDPGVSP